MPKIQLSTQQQLRLFQKILSLIWQRTLRALQPSSGQCSSGWWRRSHSKMKCWKHPGQFCTLDPQTPTDPTHGGPRKEACTPGEGLLKPSWGGTRRSCCGAACQKRWPRWPAGFPGGQRWRTGNRGQEETWLHGAHTRNFQSHRYNSRRTRWCLEKRLQQMQAKN